MSRAALTDETKVVLRALGDAIRALRREAGLEQGQAGARAGFGPNGWGQVERAHGDPSVGRIVTIARVLRLPLSVLFQRVEAALLDDRAVEKMRSQLRDAASRLAPADLGLLLVIVARLLRSEGDRR